MRYVRSISLFLLFSLLSMGIGFYVGVKSSPFFYPDAFGEGGIFRKRASEEALPKPLGAAQGISGSGGARMEEMEEKPSVEGLEAGLSKEFPKGASMEERTSGGKTAAEDSPEDEASAEAAVSAETLCVDTDYVLEETDILNHTVVETTWRLPEKYIGMDRERFLRAMEVYEAFPPLSELERGFVGLEVLAFSRERVVVRMDYKFVQPSNSFYLAVYDNKVVVYLEDMRTVYIETEIRLDSLPQNLQQSIIDMMWIRDEGELYSFLENYSS